MTDTRNFAFDFDTEMLALFIDMLTVWAVNEWAGDTPENEVWLDIRP